MKQLKVISILAISLFCLAFILPTAPKNCKKFKEGTYYVEEMKGYKIVREGNNQKEYLNKKEVIDAEVIWLNDCEYNLVVNKTLIKQGMAVGDTANVRIIRTTRNSYNCLIEPLHRNDLKAAKATFTVLK